MSSLFKRLNKMPGLGLAIVFIPLFLSCGCKKKERLSTSTFNFSISPPAATVLKTGSITLTAHGSSAAGPVDVNPTWEVSSALIGSLNTSLGTTVVFQPSALGDVTITATYDGLAATSQLAIVTYIPSASTFNVYNDNGLPSGSGINSDIFDASSLLTELSSGYTPDGSKYMRAANASTGNFWGVTLDKLSTGNNADLHAYSSLKFSLRFPSPLASGENFRLDITDLSVTRSYTMVRGVDYSGSSVDWQEISLPLSNWPSGLDFTHIKVPFSIMAVSIASTIAFDCDAIRWE